MVSVKLALACGTAVLSFTAAYVFATYLQKPRTVLTDHRNFELSRLGNESRSDHNCATRVVVTCLILIDLAWSGKQGAQSAGNAAP